MQSYATQLLAAVEQCCASTRTPPDVAAGGGTVMGGKYLNEYRTPVLGTTTTNLATTAESNASQSVQRRKQIERWSACWAGPVVGGFVDLTAFATLEQHVSRPVSKPPS